MTVILAKYTTNKVVIGPLITTMNISQMKRGALHAEGAYRATKVARKTFIVQAERRTVSTVGTTAEACEVHRDGSGGPATGRRAEAEEESQQPGSAHHSSSRDPRARIFLLIC